MQQKNRKESIVNPLTLHSGKEPEGNAGKRSFGNRQKQDRSTDEEKASERAANLSGHGLSDIVVRHDDRNSENALGLVLEVRIVKPYRIYVPCDYFFKTLTG